MELAYGRPLDGVLVVLVVARGRQRLVSHRTQALRVLQTLLTAVAVTAARLDVQACQQQREVHERSNDNEVGREILENIGIETLTSLFETGATKICAMRQCR